MEPPGRYVDEEQDIEERKEMPTGNSNHPNEPSPSPVRGANKESPSNSQNSDNQSSSAHSSGSSASSALSTPSNTASATTSQPSANYPVEFEPIATYVNKVKNRLESQPTIFNQFLRILQPYGKEIRNIIDGRLPSANPVTPREIFAQVDKLFENHDDLRQEFLQFYVAENSESSARPVPVANNHHSNSQHSYNLRSASLSSGSSPSSARSTPSNTASATTSQPSANYPVEFEPVVNYVNKVKKRFEGQPTIFNQFLMILHTYQKEQRNIKDGGLLSANPLTLREINAQVDKLFENHDDLRQEFLQFHVAEDAEVGLPSPPPPPPVRGANKESPSNSQNSDNQSSSALSSGSSPSSGRSTPSNTASATTSQPSANYPYPVEFEPVVTYVNKVKNRFESQPTIFNQFLRILQPYGKEIRNIIDQGGLPSANPVTPEIFAQVDKLFENHDDLRQEFLQFHVAENTEPSPPPPVRVQNSENRSSAAHSSGCSPSSARSTPSNIASATTSQRSANCSGEFLKPAINYLNKVENRFQGQRDIFRQFLELLQRYQKELRNKKDGISVANPLTVGEVHARVAELFQDHEDLLQEFFQFLPDANALAGLEPPKPVNNEDNFVVKNPTLPVKPSTPTKAIYETNPGHQAGPSPYP